MHCVFDPVCGNAQPRGHLMPAAFFQRARGHLRRDGGPKVDAGNGSARPFAVAAVDANDHRRAIELVLQATRDDPDDTWVPALARGPDERAIGPTRFGLLDRGLGHLALDRSAGAVSLGPPPGQRGGFVCMVRHQKA